MQVMECMSTWPLLQRNKIEDSKINVAVQAIADAPIQGDKTAVVSTPVKPDEDILEPQEMKVESPESINPGSAKADADQVLAVGKSENVEQADALKPPEHTNGAVPMTVDEPNLPSERGRAPERHESQAVKLKRLAAKVSIP